MHEPEGLTHKILAIDFDGTIVSNQYPLIGTPNVVLIDKIKDFKASGGQWILWTCRNAQELKDAVEFCEQFGIPPDAVNEDVPDIKNSEFGRSKSVKPYFDLCIDDKNNTIEGFMTMNFNGCPSELVPDENEQNIIMGMIDTVSQ